MRLGNEEINEKKWEVEFVRHAHQVKPSHFQNKERDRLKALLIMFCEPVVSEISFHKPGDPLSRSTTHFRSLNAPISIYRSTALLCHSRVGSSRLMVLIDFLVSTKPFTFK